MAHEVSPAALGTWITIGDASVAARTGVVPVAPDTVHANPAPTGIVSASGTVSTMGVVVDAETSGDASEIDGYGGAR
jgi:hypothetical protein